MTSFTRSQQLLWCVFLALGLAACSEAMTQLPSLSARSLSGSDARKTLQGAKQFAIELAQSHYQLEAVAATGLVPPIFAINLPNDLAAQPVPEKTSLFIRLLLPNVVAANQQIMAQREALKAIQQGQRQGRALTPGQQRWMDELVALYQAPGASPEELLQRVDTVPVALALAQGINESGWGTSRFALQGNSLFGQHAPNHGSGKFLATPGGHVKVAAFDSVYEGTVAYLHNLNTTRAYSDLRQLRQQLRDQGKAVSGYVLAGTLLSYSERGQHYVDDLRTIIHAHQLDGLDHVELVDTVSPLLLEFTR